MSVTESGRLVENLGPRPAFVPVAYGPTWERDEDGDFVLPEHTLGWAIMEWCLRWLMGADGEHGWRFTDEQLRFILWYYAVDENGRWLYREATLQRVKGWGKDPLAAVICAVELVGPCRFGGWDESGEPIAVRQKNEPWIQIVGTAREQTKNTMAFLQGIFSRAAKREYDIQIFKEIIYCEGSTGRIEVVTSAPRTMEGNRPSLVVGNEPHHWIEANDGVEVAKTLRRNVTKMRKIKASRVLWITNAYNPAEESVAQSTREGWEKDLERGRAARKLYDSLEATESEDLIPPYTSLDAAGNMLVEYDEQGAPVPPSNEVITAHIEYLLDELCGDAHWLDPLETAEEILDPESDMAEMRRFYLNSVVSGENVFLDPNDVKATVHPQLVDIRMTSHGDELRAGWLLVGPDEPVVLFFDGSKSSDSTAIVGCRVSDGFLFLVGLWQKPPGDRGRSWLAPRQEIDERVHEAFRTFNVVAFWADPSHTRTDQDSTRYWDGLIDRWHVEWGEQLQYHAVQGGDRQSSIMWDMTIPANQQLFADEIVRFGDEMDSREILWDGHPGLRSHLFNARLAMGRFGYVMRKPSRNGLKKIDAAVCAVGAKMLSRLVLNKGLEEPEKPAKVWW